MPRRPTGWMSRAATRTCLGRDAGRGRRGAIEQVARKLHISERVLNAFLSAVAPTGLRWTDPFAALIDLGQKMVLIAVTALGAAGLLASTTGSAATAAVNVLTLNFAGAAATVVGHLMMNFLATPIFLGLMALLVPGLLIAFVLPMIPFRHLDRRRGGILHHGMRGRGCGADVDVCGAEVPG